MIRSSCCSGPTPRQSPLISRVFGHDRRGRNVEENTTLDAPASSAMAAPSSVMGSSEADAVGFGGESGHQTVRIRSHQDRVFTFRLLAEPGEILGPLSPHHPG